MNEAEKRDLIIGWGALCDRIHAASHSHTSMILSSDDVAVLDRCLRLMAARTPGRSAC